MPHDYDKTKSPPSTDTARAILRRLDRELRKVAEEEFLYVDQLLVAESEQDNIFVFDKQHYKARREIVRRVHKECDEFCDWLRSYFWREFKADEDVLPKGWMHRTKAVREMLGQKKNQFFIPLYNYLWRRRMDQEKCMRYSEEWDLGRHRTKNKKGEEFNWYYVLLGRINYEDAENKLGMSRSLIQKYLQEFCRFGILKKFGKSGPRGQTIYAIGYYSSFGGNLFRPIRFLKGSKKFKSRLYLFDPYRREKKANERKSNI